MKITIPHRINEQIQFFVDKSDIECSGLGKVITTPEGYLVTEIVLLKQENTATHTEIDASAVAKALFDLRASQGGMYFWWHSHVDMGVFWSKTDRDTIEEIGRNGLCVAVVFNKKKEKRGAVWLKGSELSPNLYFDDVTVMIEEHAEVLAARKALELALKNSVESAEVKAEWSKEFELKCKEAIPERKPWMGYGAVNPMQQLGMNYGSNLSQTYDIDAFEEALTADEVVSITNECNTLMYGLTIKEVDEALERLIATIKGSKAKKKDKRGAIMEYKEMALDQKSYIKLEAEKWEKLENGAKYDKYHA